MSTTDSLRHTQKQYPGAHYNEADMNGDAPGRDANSHSQLYLPIYNTVKDNVSTEPPTDPYRTTLERHRSNPTDAVDYSSTQNLVHENDKHYSDSNSVYASHTYEGYASTTDPTYAQVEKKKKIPRTFDDLNRLPPSSGNDPYSTYPRNPNNQAPYNPRQSTDSNIYGTVHKEPAQLPVEQAPEIVQPRQNQRNSTKRQQSEYEDIEAAHFNPAYENQDYGSASLPRHFRPQGTVDDDASKELML
ncbi:uncharacterized protein TRIADDRAFT_62096 [Trichoplax adhaerens]|uniref:Uncharacterized protein n=1 Tax=Trichoplax adhaerens TaxID=10228 RepID=B3SCU1_TRIAD|nr:predicted protein [Trichoplax adhaerens]EDV19470.1 predicted protein [Trichoplax adhaerens]|eukprot:XP_002118070.1 predicted protein [Trichoplax adhaerens]